VGPDHNVTIGIHNDLSTTAQLINHYLCMHIVLFLPDHHIGPLRSHNGLTSSYTDMAKVIHCCFEL
jgi:hypothetical protein